MAYSDAMGQMQDTDHTNKGHSGPRKVDKVPTRREWDGISHLKVRRSRCNRMNLKRGPTVSCRIGSLSERLPETAKSCAYLRGRRNPMPSPETRETVRAENPSVHSGVQPWNGGTREGFLLVRHVR